MVGIERFLNVRSAYAGSFTADDERLVFLMDTTGVPQVWSVTGPGEWPEQRTYYDERVTFVVPSPVREEVVFGMDAGGDEFTQLYRAGGDGSVVAVTAEPGVKHQWGGWSTDGSRFAFTSNQRDSGSFDVYVQDRDAPPGSATRVLESDGWVAVRGWSPDDSRLAVHESRSMMDHEIHVLDLDSGADRRVTPDDGKVQWWSVEWGPAGDALYAATDYEADTTYLGRIGLESGAVEEVVSGGSWDVSWLRIHQASERIVYSRNVEGYTEVLCGRLVDGRGVERYPSPELPRGVVGRGRFDSAGERFTVTVSGRTRNANVYVVAVETGAVTQWTRAPTARIPREVFVEPRLVHYESFDDLRIPAFLSIPTDHPGPHPAIVDIHGGPESQRRPSFSPVIQYFVNHGYAVFEPNVRGSTGYGTSYARLDDTYRRMDAVRDIEAGVRWLRARRDVDPDRIVVMGASYGGFMALAALTEFPEVWAAGIDMVGIANFVSFLENTGEWRRDHREAEYGSLAEDREFLESISPVNNIESIAAPLFVLHGANDPRVPVGEAEQIARLASEHVPVETLIFEDEGHGISKLDNRIEAYRAIVEFLDKHVSRAGATQDVGTP